MLFLQWHFGGHKCHGLGFPRLVPGLPDPFQRRFGFLPLWVHFANCSICAIRLVSLANFRQAMAVFDLPGVCRPKPHCVITHVIRNCGCPTEERFSFPKRKQGRFQGLRFLSHGGFHTPTLCHYSVRQLFLKAKLVWPNA